MSPFPFLSLPPIRFLFKIFKDTETQSHETQTAQTTSKGNAIFCENVKKEQPLLNKGTNREIVKPCDAEGGGGLAAAENEVEEKKIGKYNKYSHQKVANRIKEIEDGWS